MFSVLCFQSKTKTFSEEKIKFFSVFRFYPFFVECRQIFCLLSDGADPQTSSVTPMKRIQGKNFKLFSSQNFQVNVTLFDSKRKIFAKIFLF